MKITIVGAGGNIGQRIVKEAAGRGYDLQLITSKDISAFQLENTEGISTRQVDINDTATLTDAFSGYDVVISAYAPPHENTDLLIDASRSLIEAARNAKVRLIAVGGAGSLKVAEDSLLINASSFPEEFKSIAQAHLDTLETVYRPEMEVSWTNVSPSAYIFEGERTGKFRIGEEFLLANEKGESAISMEDFAVGILDEVDNRSFIGKRFTIGY